MQTTFEKNIDWLTNKISSKIEYFTDNREVAIGLLNKYPQSKTNLVSKLFYKPQDGILNAKLGFNKNVIGDMNKTIALKTKIRTSIIGFLDHCKALKQNGLITTAIAEELKETLSKEEIELLVYHLKR